MGPGVKDWGQRVKKSVKWTGLERGGLIVIGQGWEILVREKLGR